MDITNAELTLLAFLESIESSAEASDGCDIAALVSQGLATCESARCTLTPAGRDRLGYLRKVLQGGERPGG
jgi:hypothetical protein